MFSSSQLQAMGYSHELRRVRERISGPLATFEGLSLGAGGSWFQFCHDLGRLEPVMNFIPVE